MSKQTIAKKEKESDFEGTKKQASEQTIATKKTICRGGGEKARIDPKHTYDTSQESSKPEDRRTDGADRWTKRETFGGKYDTVLIF